MRIWVSGPRVFGIRLGVILGREDWRAMKGVPASGPTTFDRILFRAILLGFAIAGALAVAASGAAAWVIVRATASLFAA
jgi:hypothetical protein